MGRSARAAVFLCLLWSGPAPASTSLASVTVNNTRPNDVVVAVKSEKGTTGVSHEDSGYCAAKTTSDNHRFTVSAGTSCKIVVVAQFAADNKTLVSLEVTENGRRIDRRTLSIERHNCKTNYTATGNKYHWRFKNAKGKVTASGPKSKCNKGAADASFSFDV